jgi:hypothetical protein
MNIDKENIIDIFDPIYTVEDYCIDAILEGVTQYKNEKYYFNCIHSELNYDWTSEYNLTLLNDEIYKLILWNSNYWIEWSKQSILPHLSDYKVEREVNTFENILECYNNNEFCYKMEQNYINDNIINKYLKNNEPKYKLKGIFYVNNEEYNIKELFYENIHENSIKVKWLK